MNSVNFNEFKKFGHHMGISPSFVSTEDVMTVFRSLLRERSDDTEDDNQTAISYDVSDNYNCLVFPQRTC
jgi:hypothetical protein